MKKFLKSKTGIFTFTLLGIILVISLWWIISACLNSDLFPNPIDSFKRFWELFILPKTWNAIGGTLLRLLISLGISLAAGLILGIVAGLFEIIYKILNPLIIVLRTLPIAAIIYIMIVLLKPQYSLFIITNLMMFPLIYEAIASGIKNISCDITDTIKLDTRVSDPRAVTKIIIPMSLESIALGVVQSLGLGMKASIMAEVLVGTDTISGLGRMMYRGYIELDMVTVFAVAIYAIILIGLLDLLLSILKKKLKQI